MKNREAPASAISPFSADRDKGLPLTSEEFGRKAAFLREHAPTSKASLDYRAFFDLD